MAGNQLDTTASQPHMPRDQLVTLWELQIAWENVYSLLFAEGAATKTSLLWLLADC